MGTERMTVSGLSALRVSDADRHRMREVAMVTEVPFSAAAGGHGSANRVAGAQRLFTGSAHRLAGGYGRHAFAVPATRAAVDAFLLRVAQAASSTPAGPCPPLRWMLEGEFKWAQLQRFWKQAFGAGLRSKQQMVEATFAQQVQLLWTIAAFEDAERPERALLKLLRRRGEVIDAQQLDAALADLELVESGDGTSLYMTAPESVGLVLSDRDDERRVTLRPDEDGWYVLAVPTSRDDETALSDIAELRFSTTDDLEAWLSQGAEGRGRSAPAGAQSRPRYGVVGSKEGPARKLRVGRLDPLWSVVARFVDPTPTTYARVAAKIDRLPEYERQGKTARINPLAKELREQAKQLGVKGAGAMNQQELETALAEHAIERNRGQELPGDGLGAFIEAWVGGIYGAAGAETRRAEGLAAAALARRLPSGFAHEAIEPQARRVAGREPRDAVAVRPLNPFI